MDSSSIGAFHELPWLFTAGAVTLGLLCGSFLNVCIARIPSGESIIHPRSHCRACARPIPPHHNIPIISWVLLRGRCAHCQSPISWHYPAVEALTAILFAACLQTFGPTFIALRAVVLCFLLVGLIFIDARHLLLPDSFTLSGIGLAPVLNLAVERYTPGSASALHTILITLRDAAIAAALLLLVRWVYWLLRRREGLGLGDVKLLAMIAAFLGVAQACVTLFLAILAGAAFAVIWLLPRGRRASPSGKSAIALPFGSFLGIAALAALFRGPQLLHWYLNLIGWPGL